MPMDVAGDPLISNPKLFALIVDGFKDFEKVKTTGALRAIPLAPFVGVTITTVGADVSVPVPVAKLP
jgi:hypothetical protein